MKSSEEVRDEAILVPEEGSERERGRGWGGEGG